jgi:uncharacterized protein
MHCQEDYFTLCGQAGTPLSECLVIDVHTHLGPQWGVPHVAYTAESMVASMDRMGIRHAYASSTEEMFGRHSLGNDYVLEAVRRYPDRLRGYMVLNGGYREAILPEMERCYAAGLRAVKVWSYGGRKGVPYDHPNYDLVFGFAHEHGLPLLAHTWGHELDELDAAFKRHDRVRWIVAHTGCVDVGKYIHVANTYAHVYLETCLSRCPRGMIERLVAEVPLHKILWGSDQIYMSATQQIGRVLFAQITPEQKRAILGENAARVLEGV